MNRPAHAIAVAGLAALFAAAVAGASGTHSWAPNVAAAEQYALHRHGTIAFAVHTPTRS